MPVWKVQNIDLYFLFFYPPLKTYSTIYFNRTAVDIFPAFGDENYQLKIFLIKCSGHQKLTLTDN